MGGTGQESLKGTRVCGKTQPSCPEIQGGDMAKIILDQDEIIQIIKNGVFNLFAGSLNVDNSEQITFNTWQINYGDFVFEKKILREVKLEDVEDMVIEQLKTAKQEG
jgi:hypothetical protein